MPEVVELYLAQYCWARSWQLSRGLQLRKVERKVLVAEQDGGNVIPTIKGQCPVWRGECSKVFVVIVLGPES